MSEEDRDRILQLIAYVKAIGIMAPMGVGKWNQQMELLHDAKSLCNPIITSLSARIATDIKYNWSAGEVSFDCPCGEVEIYLDESEHECVCGRVYRLRHYVEVERSNQ